MHCSRYRTEETVTDEGRSDREETSDVAHKIQI
jgi:hypothetical protein